MICLNVWTRDITDFKKKIRTWTLCTIKSHVTLKSVSLHLNRSRDSQTLNSWKTPGVGRGGGYFGFISNRERHRSVSHAVSVHVS